MNGGLLEGPNAATLASEYLTSRGKLGGVQFLKISIEVYVLRRSGRKTSAGLVSSMEGPIHTEGMWGSRKGCLSLSFLERPPLRSHLPGSVHIDSYPGKL